jgi:hypothetical protein
MSAKKPKLRDATNLTPEDLHTIKAAGIASANAHNGCSFPSAAIGESPVTGGLASPRSLEQHYIATVHAVLHSLRQSCSQFVPWSLAAVSVA